MTLATTKPTRPADGDNAAPIRVGDLLLDQGVITREQINQALSYQRDRGKRKLLGEILVEMNFVTREQVVQAVAKAYDLPFARITPKVADPVVIELLPREFVDQQGVLPLFLVEGKLTVAVHEPANVFLLEELERLSGHSVQLVVATLNDIRQTLQTYLSDANVFVIDDIVDDLHADDLAIVENPLASLTDLESAASDSPVIKLVNYTIHTAVREGASDIHIEPGNQSLRIRFRIDGKLFEKLQPPVQLAPAIVSRIKIMSGLDISERRQPQDGGITVMIQGRPIDLRVSTMPGKFGEKVVMRVTDNRSGMATLEQLGFPPTLLERFRGLIRQPNGVVLVTGPTGSGKSTTLYAALNEINNESVNICTVEDPVENNVTGVNQFQVNDKAKFTFASALRSLLRQDPDILMVGEVRDPETALIASQAALTGHLVLSTLHTNDAMSAITRLINIGVEPFLVAASVKGILAQRLIRRICSNCKTTVPPTSDNPRISQLLEHASPPFETLYRGTGCVKCHNTGYAGRVGIYELFTPNDAVLESITRGDTVQEMKRLLEPGDYTTLLEDGIAKIRAGLTTAEEVITATAVN